MDKLYKWKLDSAGYQQMYYERFGDREWDSIDRIDTNTLNTKISYALFGKPFGNCSSEDIKCVEDTRSKILVLNGSGNVSFGCLIVCVLLKNSEEPYIFPLIRIRQSYEKNDVFFIERQPGRVYRGFNDFLTNNKLPKCDMCFPSDGFYRPANNGLVRVRFQKSPSCDFTFKILDIVSLASKAAAVSLLTASSFFPVIGPVVAASIVVLGGTTTYSTTRNIIHLVDRGTHHETLLPSDDKARLLWLEISSDITGALLVGGTAALPRLLRSGRLAASAVTTTCGVLSWVSIGVNSCGFVANIISLIVKFKNGTLSKNDIDYFVSSCLFICNLIISVSLASEIINQLCDQPSQLHRLFKMTVNTSFKAVKTTISCFSIDAAMDVLCGSAGQSCFKFMDLPYTGWIVKEVGEILQKFQQENGNPAQLCFELYKLLTNYIKQAREEVDEAIQKLSRFSQHLANNVISVDGRRLFHDSRLLAPDVVYSIEDVVDNLRLSDEVIEDNSACAVMKLVVELSRKSDVKNEQQFANVCKIVTDDIKLRCDRRLILNRAERKMTTVCDKQIILDEVVKELRNEFKQEESLPSGSRDAANQLDGLFLRYLYHLENVTVYAFETNTSFGELDQFLNDASCKLLGVESLPGDVYIHWDSERTMVVRWSNKSLLFLYERPPDAQTAFGIILVTDEKSNLYLSVPNHS